MMIQLKRRAAALLLTAAVLLGTAAPALAEDADVPAAPQETAPQAEAAEAAEWAPASAYQLRAPLFAKTQVLDLPRNTTSFWFSLPQGTVLGQDCSLNLHVSVTDTLINERSSITFAVNGEQVETVHLLDLVDAAGGWWRVTVPAELLKTDGTLNEFTIATAQRSIEGDCADIDNPANWVKLHDDSYVEVGVEAYGALALSNVYESFFNSLTSANQLAAEFVLPSTEDEAAVTALLNTAAAIGSAYPYKDFIDFQVSPGVAAGLLPHQLFLGTLEGWAAFAQPVLPELAAGQGYAAVSGQDGGGALVLSGADEAGLAKAVHFFSDSAYLGQASGDALVVESELPKQSAAAAAGAEGYYTLADFGYSTTSLAGAFHQTVSYTLTQPGGLQSGGRSYVEVHFRHSEALVSDNSLLTVYINDEPIASVKLSSSNADEGKVKAAIPAEALTAETFTLRVDCYNYLGKVDCSKDYYDTAWTVIDDDTVVYLEPGEAAVRPTLRSFPLFSGGREDADVVLCLPAGSNSQTLSLAATLAARAGQNSKTALEWALPRSFAPDQQHADVVFLGSADAVELPAEVQEALLVAPNGSGGYTVSDQVKVLPETLGDKIVLQVLRSPWDFDRRVYVVTYAPGLEDAARALLADTQTLQKLTGHVAVADAQGNVRNFTIEDPAAEVQSIPLTVERVLYLVERATGLSIWVLGLLALAIVAAIVLIVRVLRNKTRFAKAAHTMSVEQQLDAAAASQPGKDAAEEEDDPHETPEA